MTELKAIDAVDAAAKGGFYYGHGLIWITAIGMAESRLDTHGAVMDSTARHTNSNGSIDRGWLQINSIHTNISDADCDDPIMAAAYAFTQLSQSGTVFTPWSTYNNGAAKSFYPVAALAYTAWKAQQDLTTANALVVSLHARIAKALADLS